jgi:hypothetical protein
MEDLYHAQEVSVVSKAFVDEWQRLWHGDDGSYRRPTFSNFSDSERGVVRLEDNTSVTTAGPKWQFTSEVVMTLDDLAKSFGIAESDPEPLRAHKVCDRLCTRFARYGEARHCAESLRTARSFHVVCIRLQVERALWSQSLEDARLIHGLRVRQSRRQCSCSC